MWVHDDPPPAFPRILTVGGRTGGQGSSMARQGYFPGMFYHRHRRHRRHAELTMHPVTTWKLCEGMWSGWDMGGLWVGLWVRLWVRW